MDDELPVHRNRGRSDDGRRTQPSSKGNSACDLIVILAKEQVISRAHQARDQEEPEDQSNHAAPPDPLHLHLMFVPMERRLARISPLCMAMVVTGSTSELSASSPLDSHRLSQFPTHPAAQPAQEGTIKKPRLTRGFCQLGRAWDAV